jgi:hypothetical protein
MIKEFESQVFSYKLSIDQCEFVGEILDFFEEQVGKTSDTGPFVGSSEILESFFGKFKSMEGDQCKAGFTGLVLAAHAHIGELDEELITKALSSVTTKQVQQWIQAEVGSTIQSKRKQLLTSAKRVIKKIISQESSGVLQGKVMGF